MSNVGRSNLRSLNTAEHRSRVMQVKLFIGYLIAFGVLYLYLSAQTDREIERMFARIDLIGASGAKKECLEQLIDNDIGSNHQCHSWRR